MSTGHTTWVGTGHDLANALGFEGGRVVFTGDGLAVSGLLVGQ